MVNTFLTDSDFNKSAANLDIKRLGKQRVEAYQILCLCFDLRHLAEYYNEDLPNKKNMYKWIRSIASKYKKDDFKFVVQENVKDKYVYYCYNKYSKKITDEIPKKIDFKQDVTIDGHQFKTSSRVVTLGFVYHPAVQMWLGHEDSLMLYINAHINLWVKLGYKNTMYLYDILDDEDNVKHPEWVFDENIHRNHKAALVRKEIDRKETPWYVHKQDFLDAGHFDDYIWPIIKSTKK